jgi:hypothetical protein
MISKVQLKKLRKFTILWVWEKGQELVKEEKMCISLELGNELVGEADKQMASKSLTILHYKKLFNL